MSVPCVPWYMLRGNMGLSKHGDPVVPHVGPLNQNLAHVRTRGRGGGGGDASQQSIRTHPPKLNPKFRKKLMF